MWHFKDYHPSKKTYPSDPALHLTKMSLDAKVFQIMFSDIEAVESQKKVSKIIF